MGLGGCPSWVTWVLIIMAPLSTVLGWTTPKWTLLEKKEVLELKSQ